MKKFIIIVLASIILSGCNVITGLMDVILDSPTPINNAIIDQKDPLDERKVFEQAMEKQQEIVKLGFITEEDEVGRIGITYYADDDALYYNVSYLASGTLSYLFLDVMPMYEEELADNYKFENLKDMKEMNHDKLIGVFGKDKAQQNPVYEMLGKYENNLYNLTIAMIEEEDDDGELIEMMSNTLKTVADGAYEPLYDLMSIDLDNLNFPMFNQANVTVESAQIEYLHDYETNTTLNMTYKINDYDILYYTVSENESELANSQYKREGRKVTETDTTVTSYKSTSSDSLKFTWTDGMYFYEIDLLDEDSDLTDKDIFDMIDSSMMDDRVFENKDVFSN